MAYTKVHADWKDYPDTTTPVTEAALEQIEAGIDAAHVAIDNHLADTSDAHDASAISILDAGNDFTATTVEGALDELQADNEAHVAAADPHPGYVLESLIDAKGDLLAGSAADTVAKVTAATADNLVLTSDSAQSTGVKWATPTTGDAIPAATIAAYAGSAAPTGWLLCDGATASTATYPTLYGIIGATYGATGAGYFTLPDLRGRAPYGLGTHSEMNALGENEGASLADRSASHHHLEDPAPPTGGYSGSGYGANYNAAQAKTTGNANLQDKPAYLIVNYIIKT